MTWVAPSISSSWMWKFTVLLVGRGSSPALRNLAALGRWLCRGPLQLVRLELHLLLLPLGREVHRLDRGEVRRPRVPRQRRVLDESEVGGGVVRRLGDDLSCRLGLLRLVQRTDVVDLDGHPGKRRIGVLRALQVALPVRAGVGQLVLGGVGEARGAGRHLRGSERVVVADETFERGLAPGGGELLLAVDALLDQLVAAAPPAAALEGVE